MGRKKAYNPELSHIRERLEELPNLAKWERKKKELEQSQIEGVSKENQAIIYEFLDDREKGLFVSQEAVKGSRTPNRLLKLLSQLCFFSKQFNKSLLTVQARELSQLINDLSQGKITKSNGERYKSVREFIRDFKTFWHWRMEKQRREHAKDVQDITIDLHSPKTTQSDFFYLTKDQVDELIDYTSNRQHAVTTLFLFDSGIRPYELKRVQVADIKPHIKEDFPVLHLPESKVKKGSHGRDINLLLSRTTVNSWIKEKKADEFLMGDSIINYNRFLKRASKELFPELVKKHGRPMRAGDLRHCSACYWVQRYNKERELMYRFGWRRSDKIEYYTSFLGIKDTMNEDQMLIESDKSEMQKEIDTLRESLEKLKVAVLTKTSESLAK